MLSNLPGVSRNGRFSVFEHGAGLANVYVHDRLTSLTNLVSVTPEGGSGDGHSRFPTLSANGSTVVFQSEATNLVPGDLNGASDLFIRAPDPTDAGSDLSGDGEVDDVVLEVLDTTQSPPRLATLGPAGAASVTGGAVAFLWPEAADGVDRNGDGDTSDARVHLWTGGAPIDLGRDAVELALSRELIAAGVPVAGRPISLDVYDRETGSWLRVAEGAADLAVKGRVVAYRLFGSHELHLSDHRASAPRGIATGLEALDYVLGDHLVAFRTPEASVGEDLNGDDDQLDAVLQA
jgi:hypothetical protein